jgi:DtxR family transcriptional regulator, Mn-dependent transcriptional regulator
LSTLTIENYVKAIYQVCVRQDKARATTGELAEALNVSPGTVTSMLKTLGDAGLAEYTPYEGVALAETGRLLALRVLRRHRLIELFLARTLHMTWDEVHDEAENMEHAVSDFLIDRMDAFLGYPATDPHGDPIPRADGSISVTEGLRLTDWQVGAPFRLVRVLDQSPEFLRYLSETGLSLGSEGALSSIRDEAGVVTVTIGERDTALARATAEKLLVTSIHDDDSADK